MLLSKLREHNLQSEDQKRVGFVLQLINGCDLTNGKYLYAQVLQGLSSQVSIILGFSISQEDDQLLSLQPGTSIWFQILLQDMGQRQTWGEAEIDGVLQPDRNPPHTFTLFSALSGLGPHGRCHPMGPASAAAANINHLAETWELELPVKVLPPLYRKFLTAFSTWSLVE